MALAKDKWAQAVAKLIQKTQDRRLKWQPVKLKYEGTTFDITSAFATTYQDKGLRIYRTELANTSLATWTPALKRKRVTLEIVDNSGQPIWTFPDSDALSDLLSAIEYQAAGVDDFLNELLRD